MNAKKWNILTFALDYNNYLAYNLHMSKKGSNKSWVIE